VSDVVFNPKEYFKDDRAILWSRFFATLIDFALLGVILFLGPLIFGLSKESYSTVLPFLFILVVLYYVALEFLFGITLGKKLIGIKVVNADGDKPSLLQVLSRTATRLIEVNPFLLGAIIAGLFAFFTPCRQRFGDLISRTYVVYK
jgi:uncharacterized RDD family membrane protein YckC